ncbi:MAG TPA: hypothetical protein DIC60_04395 [Lachnospiraceae bacterium]|nr:hypothetical protein [Lachnospiraceae bacterium]
MNLEGLIKPQGNLEGNKKNIDEKINVEGNGVILLTGPSGCGKGEIAKALCTFLSIPTEMHLSMGEILRKTIDRAKKDNGFKNTLAEKYKISDAISIFKKSENKSEVINKAQKYRQEIISFMGGKNNFVSQFHWLEFCVANGLLVPDEWTEKIMDALFENTPELNNGMFILDGYPRTVEAADSLLSTFKRLDMPIVKVLHLFITKEEMIHRALNRKRVDDTEESLEKRYQFYIEKVQPCIDYLKRRLGSKSVALIDAHQPFYKQEGLLDIEASIKEVFISVMSALTA